jgi:hypothetical protein
VRYELCFYIPEHGILHSHRRENLKSYIVPTKSYTLRGHFVPVSCLFFDREEGIDVPPKCRFSPDQIEERPPQSEHYLWLNRLEVYYNEEWLEAKVVPMLNYELPREGVCEMVV